MYSVLSYGQMANDGVRLDAYSRAIEQAVRPGSIVVDLGCGTGFMSLLALRAGARRVHAVDMDPAVWLARDLAVENGYGDKLEVHHGSSFDLKLTERADVILADLRGSFPFFQQNLATLEDAKARLLAPGGVLTPKRDRLFVGIVEAESHRRDLEQGWSVMERQGFKAAAAKHATLHCAYSDADFPIRANQVLSDAKTWGEITYGEPFSRTLNATVDLTITRGGTAHALAVWFEATVMDGIVYSNAPGHLLVYKRLLLPLIEPTRVKVGEAARVTLRTDVGGDQWAWETQVASGPRVRQATFLGLPTSPDALVRQSLGARPERSSVGDRASHILALMDGTRSIQEIADMLAASEKEARPAALLEEVKSCARRYAR